VLSPTIQAFGDSTEAQLAPLLAAHYGARFSSRAVPGTTSSQLLAGTDGLNPPWPGSVTGQVVVIAHGLNDGCTCHPGTLTPEQFAANLERLIDLAPLGTRMVLQTPLPSANPARPMAAYAQAVRDVAAARGAVLVDVFACFSATPGYAGLFVDGTHLTDAGKQVEAACVEPVLDAL